MNIYFLVEGKTEKKVYPKWLPFLIPELKQVQQHDKVVHNNYFVFMGNGYENLLSHLPNSIGDVNDMGEFDYFIVCIDADDKQAEERRQEVLDAIEEGNIALAANTQLAIVVQQKCMETWFLGNPAIFKENPENNFLKVCVPFYNVKQDDPELMGKPAIYEGSIAQFHYNYLQNLLKERNVFYRKDNPQEVVEKYFLDKLIERNKTTTHLP